MALIASAMEIVRVARRHSCFNCWHVGTRQEPASALSRDAIHARQGELGIRRIQGVLQLVKQYGCALRRCLCNGAGLARRRVSALCAAIWSAIRRLLSA